MNRMTRKKTSELNKINFIPSRGDVHKASAGCSHSSKIKTKAWMPGSAFQYKKVAGGCSLENLN